MSAKRFSQFEKYLMNLSRATDSKLPPVQKICVPAKGIRMIAVAIRHYQSAAGERVHVASDVGLPGPGPVLNTGAEYTAKRGNIDAPLVQPYLRMSLALRKLVSCTVAFDPDEIKLIGRVSRLQERTQMVFGCSFRSIRPYRYGSSPPMYCLSPVNKREFRSCID